MEKAALAQKKRRIELKIEIKRLGDELFSRKREQIERETYITRLKETEERLLTDLVKQQKIA